MRLFNATYRGYECTVRLVEDNRGETVVTADGNVEARAGDYIAIGVDKAPRGYRNTTIDRVIRRKDSGLVVGAEIVPEEEEEEEEPRTLDDLERSGDLSTSDSER